MSVAECSLSYYSSIGLSPYLSRFPLSSTEVIFLLTLTNNTCTLLALKKRLFNPLVQLKELPLLNRNKKELITTTCEQLSSTEGAPTVTRSLVSLRSSFDLELQHRREKRYSEKPISCPVLRTWLKREKKTGLKEISLSTIELHFHIRLALEFTFRNPCSWSFCIFQRPSLDLHSTIRKKTWVHYYPGRVRLFVF